MQNNNSRKFIHRGLEYEFKWAKLLETLNQMPKELAQKIQSYFDYILGPKFPFQLFDAPDQNRCSNFKLKGLRGKKRDALLEPLFESGKIQKIMLIDAQKTIKDEGIPKIIYDLPFLTTEIYFENMQQGSLKPDHDAVLTKILLSSDAAISTETPVWTRKQAQLSDFMDLTSFIQKEHGEQFDFGYAHTLTGHIDLLAYDNINSQLIIIDYKPEGYFHRSLPQVAAYGLILKRILKIKNVYACSFNKDEAWFYDPEILREDFIPYIINEQENEPNNRIVKSNNWIRLIKKL